MAAVAAVGAEDRMTFLIYLFITALVVLSVAVQRWS